MSLGLLGLLRDAHRVERLLRCCGARRCLLNCAEIRASTTQRMSPRSKLGKGVGFGDGDAVQVSKEMERTAQQVLGGSHPITTSIELDLKDARAELRE